MMTKITDWHGCYDGNWQGVINDEAMSHPAKFSRNLIWRIYEHLLDLDLIQPGDSVIDPFGGVGLGAWPAVMMGLNWHGVELEQRFVDLGAGCDCTGISKADWIRFYGRWDRANYKDGRHWCPACLAQAKAAVDESPVQFSLFGAEPTATYRRNSGLIPFTAAHHYQGNIDLFQKRPEAKGRAVLLQGDSRRLCEVINAAGGVVSSPPYIETNVGNNDGGNELKRLQKKAAAGQLKGEHLRLARQGRLSPNEQANLAHYGQTPGQLGAMPEGRPVVVSSPPYANIDPEKNGSGINIKKQWQTYRASGGGQSFDAFCRTQARHSQGYGNSVGQLSGLPEGDPAAVISSPPFSQSVAPGIPPERERQTSSPKDHGAAGPQYDQWQNIPGQLGAMKEGDINAVVSSPPWAGNSGGRGEASRNGIDPALFDRHQGGMVGGIGGPGNLAGLEPGEVGAVITSPGYGGSEISDNRKTINSTINGKDDQNSNRGGSLASAIGAYSTEGNVSSMESETFWAAAKTIVEQCALILPPGHRAVWVVKSFVRDGAIVDFPGQWQALCEACGFETMEIVRAWLVKDKGTQFDLEGNGVRKTVARKSFFRRLHEQRRPDLAIDYEIVLITRRTLQAAH